MVAARIEEIRESRGLSLEDVAKRLRTSRMRVWRLENGVTEITVDDALQFASVFDVAVAELYDEAAAS